MELCAHSLRTYVRSELPLNSYMRVSLKYGSNLKLSVRYVRSVRVKQLQPFYGAASYTSYASYACFQLRRSFIAKHHLTAKGSRDGKPKRPAGAPLKN